uniref:Protein-cysteine N-palmitoyltransferase porcupine-like n=1 Tax=Stegastes partitus TaxID=144197 RepID=A0A3B4ZLM6_9TELE
MLSFTKLDESCSTFCNCVCVCVCVCVQLQDSAAAMSSRLAVWQQLAESCGLSTVQQGVQQVWRLLLLCLVCRLCFRLGVASTVKHVVSALAGMYGLFLFFELHVLWMLLLSALCYFILLLCRHSSSRGIFLSAHTAEMVVAMKAISLAFDLDRGVVGPLPSPAEFLGYALFVGTVVFGPWISFSSYKNAVEGTKLSWLWLYTSSLSLLKSQACLLVSTCMAPYLFPLFIPIHGNSIHLRKVRPNSSLKTFLFLNVFKNAMKLGTFPAILVTYTASALLHGLSFHLGAVLLSLGFITYVEHVLRRKLATTFSACILSRPCASDCSHQHKKEYWVLLLNVVFSVLVIFHLTYLGSMFDPGLDEQEAEEGYAASHTIQRWSELNWASHWVVFASWVFYRLI